MRGFAATPNHPGPPRGVDDEAVVALYHHGLTHRRIADDELGCGVTTVRERLHEAGIRQLIADPGPGTEIPRRWAVETLRQIARAVGMSRTRVAGAVQRLGVERRRSSGVRR